MPLHSLPELQAAYQTAHLGDRGISLELALANPYLRDTLESEADHTAPEAAVQTSATQPKAH
ncbi:MAG TPA: hypothetical protein VGK09_08260 [Rhodocyclaceae bacterium]|jgi:hypothetical protein